MSLEAVIFALFFAGISGAVWLWFWLKEDDNPEPPRMLALAFFAGVVSVLLSIFAELGFATYKSAFIPANMPYANQINIFAYAFLEEFIKFFTAFVFVLRSRENDEPVDSMIYMIVVAIGFAFAENFLYLLTPLQNYGLSSSVLYEGNWRFLGSTLLHVLSSATLGAFLAFSFFKRHLRIPYLIAGLFVATVIHHLFNFALDADISIFKISAFVWLGLVFILIAFEKVKRLKI